jgi:nucleotide-binding universal stress UspA family protein
MKTLLVATDFSTAAHQAFLYSLDLAHALEARIVLFHAYLPVTATGLETPVVPMSLEELERVSMDRLQQHLRAAKDIIRVVVELRCGQGVAAQSIVEAARATKADLIVAGIKAHGKVFRRIFGSTVTALTTISLLPQLLVPETASYRKPGTLALASDASRAEEAAALEQLSPIGQCFHAKVYVIRLAGNELQEVFPMLYGPSKPAVLTRDIAQPYTIHYSKEVVTALHDFVREQQVAILALLPHRPTLLKQLFHKSHTKAMIFTSDIPLLILPDKKKQAAQPAILPD